jgi:hypothetical protein
VPSKLRENLHVFRAGCIRIKKYREDLKNLTFLFPALHDPTKACSTMPLLG